MAENQEKILVAVNDSALARALGVTPQAVNGWKRKSSWAFRAPYDVAAVEAWRVEALNVPKGGAEAAGPEAAEADHALAIARIEKVRLQREIKGGQRTTAEVLKLAGLVVVAEFVLCLEDMALALPPLAAGAPAPACSRMVREQVSRARGRLEAAERRAMKSIEQAPGASRRMSMAELHNGSDSDPEPELGGMTRRNLQVHAKIELRKKLEAECRQMRGAYPLSTSETGRAIRSLRHKFDLEFVAILRRWPGLLVGKDGPGIEAVMRQETGRIRNRLAGMRVFPGVT